MFIPQSSTLTFSGLFYSIPFFFFFFLMLVESESQILGCVWVFIVHGILQARILEWVAVHFSRGQTQVSHIAGGLFTSWATREAQEYWSWCLSFLQGIFLTQNLNQTLLHCRWILYQNPLNRFHNLLSILKNTPVQGRDYHLRNAD